MAESLFPTTEVPELLEEADQFDETYKPSVAWDFEKGDFVRNSAHQMVQCAGKEAYKVWCIKMVCTERYSCLAYPDELGVEMEEALKEDTNSAVESAVERTISEALLVNPRTEYVRDFEFTWNGDELHCSFQVKGIEWEDEIPLSVTLGSDLEVISYGG